MISSDNIPIQASLAWASQFKTDVNQTAQEFQQLRQELLQNLQSIQSRTTVTDSQCSSSAVMLDDSADEEERFQQVSDDIIQEHAITRQPALTVFGANSSGKTSFIQRFLGIGNILPSGIGPITARIVQLTYAPGNQACFRVYKTIEKLLIEHEGNLSSFFSNNQQPDWESITNILSPHVKRPTDINEKTKEFNEWAECFVEVCLPSDILSLGIDIYDTPGFLSDNREQILTDNLHKLVKRIKPTLLFLYDNATISDTDKSCFLAMKNALGSMERVSVFFLNTKADCISIANDYLLDDDPENVPLNLFENTLREKKQRCYELLLRRREMASEVLGRLPDSVDECTCFDICTIPSDYDPWEVYTNMINTAAFRRIVQFAVEAYSTPTFTLARDILMTVDDFFDYTISTTPRSAHQWDRLRKEALEWGQMFFDEYQKLSPTLTDDMTRNILNILKERKPEIIRQAALITRTNDPIDTLLDNHSKTIRNYIRLAVQEQVIKVAANNTIIAKRDEVKTLINNHLQRQRGVRKNELLTIAQRQVLSEISVEVLEHTTLFNSLLDNIVKLPLRLRRFLLSLPTRISAYIKEEYNRFNHPAIKNDVDNVYKLLDPMDEYATLPNEANRKTFADYCMEKIAREIEEQRDNFSLNVISCIEEQRKAFFKNIASNQKYIEKHLSDQQTLHNLINQFSGRFSKIECQLLAAVELAKHCGIRPILGEQIGMGGFFTVHTTQWGTETNLAVKKLIHSSAETNQMVALEAHYHRIVTRLCSDDHIVPLLHVYENNIANNQSEFWLIMPRYPMSLRDYLIKNIHQMHFSRAVSFALSIATSLAKLHHLEIVHRDIKSSNIMLDDNEQCYIIDFGTAKSTFYNKTILGTVPLPPEIVAAYSQQHTGFVTYDGAAADIYSFGLLLYEMLPKSSYQQLDINALPNTKQLLLAQAQSKAYLQVYIDQIFACLDPIPTKRPRADHLVAIFQSIPPTIEIKLCMSCEERERTVRFLPCQHKVMCEQCWQQWRTLNNTNVECIVCKTIVTIHTQDNCDATFFVQPK
ncbi:unnamed protein product [Rotaria socialis]|uniref:Non-specific serine/threonine protein kinase n=6 Tax=Rotaria socialis TaxID=392032 RepID=A0A818QRJ6_9BILA|nr:unnamed protein product [Rotaria socialis]CAF4313387.1 unnamed protein product [Rotaria socialis]